MFFKGLGSFVSRFWIAIIIGWAIIAALLFALAPNLGNVASSEEANFLPLHSDSVLAKKLLDRYFPGDSFSSRAVLVMEKESALDDADLLWLDQAATTLASDPTLRNIRKVLTPLSNPFLKDKLVSKDRKAAMAVIYLTTNFIAQDTQNTVGKILQRVANPPSGLTLAATGDALVGSDYHHAIDFSLGKTTWATILMLSVILFFIFRSPITPLVSLISIALAFLIAKSVIGLIALAGATVSPLTEIFLVVVMFGAGTNYCIFLIFRYVEEITHGSSSTDAIKTSLQTVGEAITSSAFTVMIGLGSLIFAQFGPFSQTGPYVALGVAIALGSGLTLTPALILALHKILFWPAQTLGHDYEPLPWQRVAAFVTRRPALTCWALFLALSPFLYYGYQTQRSFDLLRELPETFSSRRGVEILKNHFSPGEMSPLVLVLESKNKLNSPLGLDQIYQLTRVLALRPEIKEVRSAVWPTGDPKLLEVGLLKNQVEKVGAGMDKLIAGTKEMQQGLDRMREKVGVFEKDLKNRDLVSTSSRVSGVRLELAKAIATIDASQRELQKKSEGGISLISGAAREEYQHAKERLETLRSGLVKISDGLKDTAEGAQEQQAKALAGLEQWSDGLTRLSSGIAEMASGLRTVAIATQSWTAPSSPAYAAMEHLVLPPDILAREPRLKEAFDYYLSPEGTATRLILVLRAMPYSDQEKNDILALKGFLADRCEDIFSCKLEIRDTLPIYKAKSGYVPNFQFHFAGSGATILDERIVTDRDFYKIIGYVLGGIFLVLLLLLRAWRAPIYLIGTMIFSYFASLGLTSLVFEHGMGHAGLDWKVPFFMFVLLVALGEDYNIFLMARIKEERKKIALVDSVRRATVRTGPLITYCGLIMAVTFLSLMLSPLEALMELGFGVTVGVLLDTFLVRPLLVPALVVLVEN